MQRKRPTAIELLAPARNAMTAIEAVRHGADAVYIGGPGHGARAAATNSIDDLRRVVEYAAPYRARVYATLNTLVYDSELGAVRDMAWRLWEAGVDAIIVQDLALLRLDLPPIPLHASTQTDLRTPEKARFMADAGFSQLVLPRELTLGEIAAVRAAVPPDIVLEAFVHGALCVSYSGDCQASQVTQGRSANRGECAQICRLPYDLLDGDRRCLMRGKHLLSLRDMNRLAHLGAMLQAGIQSFKIEGRLKDIAYVKQTVAAYSQALDRIVAANSGQYERISKGRADITFTPDLSQTFNRGYTPYFLDAERPRQGSMATFDTPKAAGIAVGKVSAIEGCRITVDSPQAIANGDGLTYIDPRGQLSGFRVNKAQGNTLHTREPQCNLRPGTMLYRNHSAQFERMMEGNTARRTLAVRATLRHNPRTHTLAIDLEDERGVSASAATRIELQEANTPQQARHESVLGKTGRDYYRVTRLHDEAAHLFIPASTLTELRRRAFDTLDRAAAATKPMELRRTDRAGAYIEPRLTYHDNVANRESAAFYRSHGAEAAGRALEVAPPLSGEPLRVMTTRYCLRRELGACLREKEGSRLKEPLILKSGRTELQLHFDCANCRMHVLAVPDNRPPRERDRGQNRRK